MSKYFDIKPQPKDFIEVLDQWTNNLTAWVVIISPVRTKIEVTND